MGSTAFKAFNQVETLLKHLWSMSNCIGFVIVHRILVCRAEILSSLVSTEGRGKRRLVDDQPPSRSIGGRGVDSRWLICRDLVQILHSWPLMMHANYPVPCYRII